MLSGILVFVFFVTFFLCKNVCCFWLYSSNFLFSFALSKVLFRTKTRDPLNPPLRFTLLDNLETAVNL